MIEDWVQGRYVEEFKRDFRGVALELQCPGCGTVNPVLFEERTDEYEALRTTRFIVPVEVECYECGTRTRRSAASLTVAWDSSRPQGGRRDVSE